MAQAKPPPSRILVIHTAFLGDIVLATPVFAALRRLAPAAEIRFLTTPAGAALLTPNPWGVVCVPFHKRGKDAGLAGFWRVRRALRGFQPDLVFSLHRSLRSTLLARGAGGVSWGFREAAGAFLLHRTVSRTGIEFEAQKNLRVIEAWAGRADFSPYPELAVSALDEAEAEKLVGGVERFVALAPSSVWATKRWPAEKFGALARQLWREKGLRSVIVGSDAPEDVSAAAAVVAAFGGQSEAGAPLNLAGRTGLGGLKSVLSRAELVVSNDSSPLHMAIARQRKVLGIFGPTTKALGFFPLAPPGQSGVAQITLECRPCGLHGHHECPLGHFRCMLDLDVNQVYREAEKLLCP